MTHGAEPRADAAFKAKVESRLAASLAERGYKQLAKRDLIFHLEIQSADGSAAG
jgi:hypothetical protein